MVSLKSPNLHACEHLHTKLAILFTVLREPMNRLIVFPSSVHPIHVSPPSHFSTPPDQHPPFIMTTLSSSRIYSTFHSNTTALPTEITTQILNYVTADAQPLPLGGGVTTRSTHHPIASVSQTLRLIYLEHPYLPSTRQNNRTSQAQIW